MLTIDDIDDEFPELELGEEYRDLYQHHYGRMPKDLTWPTIADFRRDLEDLRLIPLDNFGDEDEEEDTGYDILSMDDLYAEENLLDEAGYDRRMNRYNEDEW